jgi:hypothetical protein
MYIHIITYHSALIIFNYQLRVHLMDSMIGCLRAVLKGCGHDDEGVKSLHCPNQLH